MPDRDLIAEGRRLLPAPGELLTSGQAFDLAEWAGLNLAGLLDKLERAQDAATVAKGRLKVARDQLDQLKLAWEQRGLENDSLQRRIAELEQQAAKLRDFAETWAAQEPVDDAEWIEQQIADGRAVLAILDGQPEANRG